MSQLLRKVLVANRGQIACRIMRTAKKMGIQTVAIYSDIDKDSKFVGLADQAYRVGPAPSLESYLNSKKIIEIAKSSGCEGLHPGFGFLSENAAFAQQCNENGVKFIGPPASAIIQMGSKSASKNIMTNAKVPVVPGYHGQNQDPSKLLQEARQIGFPVLIKAVSGGGGKGMRIVHKEQDFAQALQSCKRQALKAFKDQNVLVQKYIVKPRHIQVQVFGDMFGNYIHFFQRDCSIQRRHQKVVQEAPSNISQTIREQICQSAVDAAKAVGYYNAGTVQFIFDLTSNKHYFMEMNTRLQVEHPISEMITGQDFVQWQFLVASGFKLPKTQKQIKKKGHAIEVRVYSQNPYGGFLPGNGKLHFFRQPIQKTNSVRIETGVRQGDTISTFYDPMIAKLITYADTRAQAIMEMRRALREYRVVGLPTNLKFLKNVLDNDVFFKGDYDTGFIQKNSESLIKRTKQVSTFDLASAVAAKLAVNFSKIKLPSELFGFRNGRGQTSNMSIKAAATFFQKDIELNNVKVEVLGADKAKVTLNGKTTEVSFKLVNPHTISITADGRTGQRQFHQSDESIYLFDDSGDTLEFTFQSNHLKVVKGQQASELIVKSPMPGTIVKVFTKVGDKVKKGSPLFILEAMKMEHTIRASNDHVVKKVLSKVGAFVEAATTIIELE